MVFYLLIKGREMLSCFGFESKHLVAEWVRHVPYNYCPPLELGAAGSSPVGGVKSSLSKNTSMINHHTLLVFKCFDDYVIVDDPFSEFIFYFIYVFIYLFVNSFVYSFIHSIGAARRELGVQRESHHVC